VTVLVALLFVAAAALRGYVPGADRAPREPRADDPVALAIVVVLLVAAVAVVVVAVIVRLRSRAATPPRVAGRSDWLRGDRGKPTWRAALIAFGLLLGWLVLSMLLGRLGGGSRSDAGGPTSPTPTPTRTPDVTRATPPTPSEPTGHLLGFFSAATVVFLAAIVVGTVVATRRQRARPASTAGTAPDGDATESDSGTGAESLARAAEVGLAEVGDLSRDPRRAIIACYAAMEQQLALLPDAAPRDFDTASEVLARAVEHHALAPDSATQLVDLFEEARFSPHVMNEGHRDAAVAVLTEVLAELRSHP
jgi:hypothetical protein